MLNIFQNANCTVFDQHAYIIMIVNNYEYYYTIIFLQVSFGLTRMFIVVVPFLYVGNLISKHFAALLEEHEIFVPDDDDDDD